VAEAHGVDAAITCGRGFEHYGLLIMDMDSTLLAVECIDEIAEHAGVKDQVAAITERAMQGELDFAGSLVERVRMLAGLPKAVLEQVYAERIRANPGAERLINTLRGLGIRVAVVSGGFTFFTDRLAGDMGLDATEANELEIADGELTGEVRGAIVDGARKAEFLGELRSRYGLSPDQVIAMGDGANDLPMIESSGMGIAYHAKPKVRDAAPYNLAFGQLDGVLYLLGLTDEQIAYYSQSSNPESR
jgi:phosphoserine phosphatase